MNKKERLHNKVLKTIQLMDKAQESLRQLSKLCESFHHDVDQEQINELNMLCNLDIEDTAYEMSLINDMIGE